LAPAAPVVEAFKQQVEEGLPIPGTAPPKHKPIPGLAGMGAGLLVVALCVFFTLAVLDRLGIHFPLAAPRLPETQSVIAPTAQISTEPPSPTPEKPADTPAGPTSTTKPPTSTLRPATKTPVQPTITPPVLGALFTASENLFCRAGPGSDYEAHVTIMEGQILPVLRMWSDGYWLLVGIDRTDTRTKCCWVTDAGGTLNVDRSTIQKINYLPDRIECNLRP
jgi:hypothetical protein